jgi:hypothetical protein
MPRTEGKRVNLGCYVGKHSSTNGLEKVFMPGALTMTVAVFLTIVVATERACLELICKCWVLAAFDPILAMEVLVENNLSNACLLSEGAFLRTTIELIGCHSDGGG